MGPSLPKIMLKLLFSSIYVPSVIKLWANVLLISGPNNCSSTMPLNMPLRLNTSTVPIPYYNNKTTHIKCRLSNGKSVLIDVKCNSKHVCISLQPIPNQIALSSGLHPQIYFSKFTCIVRFVKRKYVLKGPVEVNNLLNVFSCVTWFIHSIQKVLQTIEENESKFELFLRKIWTDFLELSQFPINVTAQRFGCSYEFHPNLNALIIM